jgi:cysteine desulfurase/selenocysteine lyase
MKQLGIKGTIRVSIAFYNNYKDVDNLIDALKRALNMLRD